MRPLAILAATLGIALAAIVATGAYRPAAGASADSTGATAEALSPPALPGTLILGKQAGRRALGIYVTRDDADRASVRAVLLAPDGRPATGLDVAFEQTASGGVGAEECGAGCYQATAPLETGRPLAVVVRDRAGTSSRVAFQIPPRWRPAAEQAAQVTSAFTALRSLVYDEHLSSGIEAPIETRWVIQAPDRLAYRIRGGPRAVVIGERRWDKLPGRPWVESETEALELPEPPWGASPVDASLLGHARIDGRLTDVLSFEAATEPVTWFTVWVDRETSLPVHLRMTTTSHFMTQSFRSFDRPIELQPPLSR